MIDIKIDIIAYYAIICIAYLNAFIRSFLYFIQIKKGFSYLYIGFKNLCFYLDLHLHLALALKICVFI
jgi:hypothetical protein